MFDKIRSFDRRNDGILVMIAYSAIGMAAGMTPLAYAVEASLSDILITGLMIAVLIVVAAAAHAYTTLCPYGLKTALEIRRQRRAIARR